MSSYPSLKVVENVNSALPLSFVEKLFSPKSPFLKLREVVHPQVKVMALLVLLYFLVDSGFQWYNVYEISMYSYKMM